MPHRETPVKFVSPDPPVLYSYAYYSPLFKVVIIEGFLFPSQRMVTGQR